MDKSAENGGAGNSINGATGGSSSQEQNRRCRTHSAQRWTTQLTRLQDIQHFSSGGCSRYNLPTKQTFLSYTTPLVKTEDQLLLNDVRAGDVGNPGDKVFPGLGHTTSRTKPVVPSLKAVGINPDGIEIVLISHAHPDHIGGLFDAEGNLAFPNARPVAQREWNHWMAAGPLTVEAVALRHHLELLIDEARRVFHAPSTKSPLCRVA